MSDFAINGIKETGLTPPNPTQNSTEAGSNSFSDILLQAIAETNQLQQQSAEEVQKLAAGEVQDIHTALIAVQKADLSFQMMMQVKNKLVNAYEEVMRMQV